MNVLVAADAMRRAAVIGAGTMGHGIAEVLARAGLEVALVDVEPAFVERGIGRIRESIDEAIAKGKLGSQAREEVLGRIRGTAYLADAVRDADLAIEAVPEDLTIKRGVFERLGAVCRPQTLLATNTSSLSVTAIAEAVDRTADRVLGLHFFNPPPIMRLVEIVRGARTSDAAVEVARDLVRRIGKEPIVVRDSPGFASSRLGIALGLEAIRMLEAGVASAEDIDTAMELGYRHPVGPLKLTDLVGLDVRLAIAERLHAELGEAFRPPELLRRLVAEGKLGRKAGEGFYKYE